MTRISFTVPIKPVGKARARVGKNGHHYTPAPTKAAEAAVALVARSHAPREPSLLPMRLYVEAFVRTPTARPDADNVLKLVADALNGVLWRDDAQVVDARCRKLMCGKTGDPRLSIVVEEVQP